MTTYSPASGCGTGCLPRPDAVPRVGWPLASARLVMLVLVLVGGLGVAALMPVLTARGRVAAMRGWFRAVLRAGGVRLSIVQAPGSEPLGAGAPGLVASNHVSWLDIPAVLAVAPMRVLAKTDVRDWPVIGLLAARGGALFIDRRRLRRLPVTVAEIAASLRGGQSVLAFPEGSTWCGRTQGRFYSATFQAAIDAGAPVRPVTLRYRFADGTPTTVAAFVGDDSLLDSVRRVVATRGLVAELEIGPTVESLGAHRRGMASAVSAVVKGAPVPVAQPQHA